MRMSFEKIQSLYTKSAIPCVQSARDIAAHVYYKRGDLKQAHGILNGNKDDDPCVLVAIESNKTTFQHKAVEWAEECIGPVEKMDISNRSHRFIEEALELVQSAGVTREDVLKLVDYVFARPIGPVAQEVGGTMVGLAILCERLSIDMNQSADDEVKRNWSKIEAIRAKAKGAPEGSPLPQ